MTIDHLPKQQNSCYCCQEMERTVWFLKDLNTRTLSMMSHLILTLSFTSKKAMTLTIRSNDYDLCISMYGQNYSPLYSMHRFITGDGEHDESSL